MCASPGRQLIELLEACIPAQGVHRGARDRLPLAGVHLLRGVEVASLPACGPVIVIGRLGAASADDGSADCTDDGTGGSDDSAAQCLVLPSALTLVPPGCATAELAVQVDIDVKVAAELVLQVGAGLGTATPPEGGTGPMPAGDALADAALRLVQALRTPAEARVLGPGIVRELLYRVLAGPQGWAVHAALGQHRHVSRIGKALRRIHAEYDKPVDVPMLASEAGMSVTAFHSHFKALTLTTPMQYVKRTRLRQARLLMARDGVSAATASRMVGYESCSQFSREFKRFFGRSPAREALALREMLAQVRQPDRPIILRSGTVQAS